MVFIDYIFLEEEGWWRKRAKIVKIVHACTHKYTVEIMNKLYLEGKIQFDMFLEAECC